MAKLLLVFFAFIVTIFIAPAESQGQTCGNNEVYSTCANANGGCGKRYSSQPTICIDPIKCEGGCVCQDGYTRDDSDNCIPEDECPVSCGGDPNAKPGCGTKLCTRCSNYKKKNVACTLACQEGGCDCKEGYVYDENTGKCVLPEDCSIDPRCAVWPLNKYYQCR